MQNKNPPGYLPQLDALRAIAVILVILSHWLPATHYLNRFLPNGVIGVTLFFVLSGYLITGILLKNKELLQQGLSLKEAFTIFYMRRSLRIFPVYYLYILLLILFFPADISTSVYWHIFYASNFYFYFQNGFSAQLSHLWSLAVEEQFYLLWPAVIFLTRRYHLPLVFLSGILVAIVFRFIMYDPPLHLGRLLMPGSLDSFSLGALLAYGQLYKTSWYNKIQKQQQLLLSIVTIFMIVVQVGLAFYRSDMLTLGLYYFVLSVFFVLLIMVVTSGNIYTSLSGPFLHNRGLLYLGKISYGLYLYHLVIPAFKGLQVPTWLLPFQVESLFLLRFMLLVVIASLSWWFFEKPILTFKRNFNNRLTKAISIPELVSFPGPLLKKD
jgi:peptidoglycan/LPS O-acetylase OafA/YrhL